MDNVQGNLCPVLQWVCFSLITTREQRGEQSNGEWRWHKCLMDPFNETTILMLFLKKKLKILYISHIKKKDKWEESKATQFQGRSQSLAFDAFVPGPNRDEDGFRFLATRSSLPLISVPLQIQASDGHRKMLLGICVAWCTLKTSENYLSILHL